MKKDYAKTADTLFELSEFAAGASSVGTPLSSNAL